MRILGIDPGLRYTGWGIITYNCGHFGFVASGVVVSRGEDCLAVRLKNLYAGLSDVVVRFVPQEAAVEKTFVSKDAVATLKLGHARGIALLVPALTGLTVAEYAPNTVKKTVVGVGHADKKQIRMMVKMLLPQAECDTEHAADALAIAITHAHQCNTQNIINRVKDG